MADVTLIVWNDFSKNWRSRWLRLGTGSSLTHCTVSVGDRTLHMDPWTQGWYPTKVLAKAYKGTFSYFPENRIYLGSVENPVYLKLDKEPRWGATWSVIRWKYLFGPRPWNCSTGCIDAIRANGFECPEFILPEKLIGYCKHDYNRPER